MPTCISRESQPVLLSTNLTRCPCFYLGFENLIAAAAKAWSLPPQTQSSLFSLCYRYIPCERDTSWYSLSMNYCHKGGVRKPPAFSAHPKSRRHCQESPRSRTGRYPLLFPASLPLDLSPSPNTRRGSACPLYARPSVKRVVPGTQSKGFIQLSTKASRFWKEIVFPLRHLEMPPFFGQPLGQNPIQKKKERPPLRRYPTI